MKLLALLFCAALPALAQTNQRQPFRIFCPTAPGNPPQLLIGVPAGAGVIFRCATLDVAGFSLDTTTTPPKLRPTAAPGPAFVDAEVPTGTLDGSNTAFTLASSPVPAASLQLFENGILLKAGTDYTLAGAAITFLGRTPQLGDLLVANYRK